MERVYLYRPKESLFKILFYHHPYSLVRVSNTMTFRSVHHISIIGVLSHGISACKYLSEDAVYTYRLQ